MPIITQVRIRTPLSRRNSRPRPNVHRACIESLEGRRLLSLSPAVSYPTGPAPQAVATGDFNGDSRSDLVVYNSDSTVSVLLGNPGGTFQPAQHSFAGGWAGPDSNSVGAATFSIAVGDFDRDGKLDLVIGDGGSVRVLLGNGNGTFRPPTNIVVAADPIVGYDTSVAVGDMNGDGKLDLAAASVIMPSYDDTGSVYVNVVLGHGDGTFGPALSRYLDSYFPYSAWVSVADLNGDGKSDVATAFNTIQGSFVATVLGTTTGIGNPSYFTLPDPATRRASLMAAGDVNADGKVDVVTVGGTPDVSVLLGDGTGSLANTQSYAAGSQPQSVAMADFTGDGKTDLVVGNRDAATVSVLPGTGGGAFGLPVPAATGTLPVGVAVGDFNGDGRADVASANAGSDNVSVLLNDGAWPDADAPSITIGDVTVTEGNAGTVNAALTVTLSAASTRPVTVDFATVDGTATVAAGDYVAAAGTLTFTPGQLSKTINVQVRGDRAAELTESFSVVLSGATNAFVGDAAGVIGILDDEPTISIDDYSAAEGNAGAKSFAFIVRLSAPSDAPVSVDFSTVEGDTEYGSASSAATGDTDFVFTSGTATFAAGQTSTILSVIVNGDRDAELDEAFAVELSGATGTHLADAHAVGTIVNDDPYASVSGGSVTEGNSGTKLLPFTFTLSSPSDVPVTVNYATSDGSATAASGDYQAASSFVTFAAGETSKTVNVTVNGDRRAEANEYFNLNIAGVTNAGIATGSATGLILDNEPRISLNSVSITEGDAGTKLMTFTATLSAAYDQSVTVNYATQNGSATAGKDYIATSGTLTFAAGQTARAFTVAIKGDKQREYEEYFYIRLTSASTNAWVDTEYSGVGTIMDNDRQLTLRSMWPLRGAHRPNYVVQDETGAFSQAPEIL